ncbi:hypothetical protein JHC27_05150 [archaeon]|jgi:uncharacterized protein YwgA|nr:hypothetical protein [archaeon]
MLLEKKELGAFIRWLKKESVIDNSFNPKEKFSDRLKLQKYVFIAKFFGMDFGYSYTLYIHGPYSIELANDYYRELNTTTKSANFNPKFIELVKGKSEEWLELASTILMLKEDHPGIEKNELKETIVGIKPWASEEDVENIIKELESYGI